MWKVTVWVILCMVGTAVFAYGGEYRFPELPDEFFVALKKTEIPKGVAGCCTGLRKMIIDHMMIPAPVAVRLFKEGKMMIGDGRTEGEYRQSRVFGAVPLPYDKVDFMRLKPSNIPIGLY